MNNDFFIKAFNDNFFSIRSKKIALYGIGYYTKVILDNFSDSFNIIGIIDKEKCGEQIYGMTVMKIEDAVCIADIIIIVSNLSSSDLIFRRIKPFTEPHNIQVYYTNGEQPENYDENISRDPYWEHTEEELINLINAHDIISFDIFDTLVVRKRVTAESVLEDVGKYIEKTTGQNLDFPVIHRQAIQECNKQNKFFDIDMIYCRIAELLGWDDITCHKIKEKEIECEISNAEPRKYAVELLKKAKNIFNKKIILTSDMYIHTADICRILSRCGIESGADYDEIYISCDRKASKYRGSMYELLKNTYSDKAILHIGDNIDSDYFTAKDKGIDAFHLRSPMLLYDASGFEKNIGSADSPVKLEAKGILLEKAFDDPFELCKFSGKLLVDNMYSFGYYFIGPVIAYYVYWIIDTVHKKKIDRLLFASRDGYLLKRAYDALLKKHNITDAPESVYFLTSRRAASVPCIESEDDIRFIIDNICKTADLRFDAFLNSTFGISCDENDRYSKNYLYELNRDELVDIIISNYYDRIIRNAHFEAECYKRYIEKIALTHNHSIGFVNLVGQGLTQKFIEKLTGRKMHGLYMAAEPSINEIYGNIDNISTAFGFNASPYTSRYNAVKKYLFLEAILTAPFGCLKRFDEKGTPVYADDSPESINEILECHNGIIDFISKLSHKPDKDYSDKFFGAFASQNVIISDDIKKCFLLSDLYGGNRKRYLF